MKRGRPSASAVLAGLRRLYPKAHCELDFKTPLELLVATVLSAQCTDKRVNEVTKELFKKYRKAKDYASTRPAALEKMIRPTGFFRAKAKAIINLSRTIVAEHNGRVPDSMEGLLGLRGVARKTANVVLGSAFGKAEGIVVDTHVKRAAFRLGLTDETDPVKIEDDLIDAVPRRSWIFLGHAMVWHGRRVCHARNPRCAECALRRICPKRGL